MEKNLKEEVILNKIYMVRGSRVMLDEDLAVLYRVETKRLNEQVNRNIARFPNDFMFRLTKNEWENLKSQFATSSWGGRRKYPLVFSEHGVLMLSSVLNSHRAIRVNIQIMRIYARLRGLLTANREILLKLERLEKNVLKNDQDIQTVFHYLKSLLNPKYPPMRRIGFKIRTADHKPERMSRKA